MKLEIEKGITTNTNEMQKIIREHFKDLYSNKLGNLEKLDTFLATCEQPKLNQETINHLNRSINKQ
jgi:hypothetical protein